MTDSEHDEIDVFIADRDRQLAAKAGLDKTAANDYELSDEEVMALDQGSSDESDLEGGQEEYYDEAQQKKSRLDNLRDWGQRRDNYYGGADEVGEEAEASEEEETEAIRLEREQVEGMNEDDFVDEDDMEGWAREASAQEAASDAAALAGSSQDQLPLQSLEAMSASERLDIIQEQYPEIILLGQELKSCTSGLKDLTQEDDPVVEIQTAALRSYIAMIYAYFALLAERVQNQQTIADLKEHPVMEGILKARELWRTARMLAPGSLNEPTESLMTHVPEKVHAVAANSDEEPELVSDHDELSDGLSDDYGSELEMEDAFGARYTDSQEESEDDFSVQLAAANQKPTLARGRKSDFDETADSIERQARAKSKQSLRFYTSQIGKQSRRPDDQFQGDTDLPYQERAYERRQRLVEEASRRGREKPDDLYGDDNEILEEAGDKSEPSLYQKVSQGKQEQRQRRRNNHADAVAAAREGRLAEYEADNPHADKRAINFQIEKNKGLIRKRKKENRNARVKKRVRYEQAEKRLRGVRREYKGQDGPYGGERTGIRKNLSHSTRFEK